MCYLSSCRWFVPHTLILVSKKELRIMFLKFAAPLEKTASIDFQAMINVASLHATFHNNSLLLFCLRKSAPTGWMTFETLVRFLSSFSKAPIEKKLNGIIDISMSHKLRVIQVCFRWSRFHRRRKIFALLVSLLRSPWSFSRSP